MSDSDSVSASDRIATTTITNTNTDTTDTTTYEYTYNNTNNNNNNNIYCYWNKRHSLGLIFGQICFGLGSVITALGLGTISPFVFALYREIAAGTILLISSYCLEYNNSLVTMMSSFMMVFRRRSRQQHNTNSPRRRRNWWSSCSCFNNNFQRSDFVRFFFLGLCVYGNQAGVIAGIKLAGPVTASVWQPSQPLMTACINMFILQREPINTNRIFGIFIAFIGCTIMVIWSTTTTSTSTSTSTAGAGAGADEDYDEAGNKNNNNLLRYLSNSSTSTTSLLEISQYKVLVGNSLFFVNCLCTSLYVILSKPILQRYPPLFVTAWTYIIASIFMLFTAIITGSIQELSSFFCSECSEDYWSIPPSAYPALLYNIIFNSVIAYGILTWVNSNQSITGTLVMIYTVLQPVTAAIITILLVYVLGIYTSCNNNDTGAAAAAAAAANNNNNDDTVICLDTPNFGTFIGTIGVFIGLCLVVGTEPDTQEVVAAAPTSTYDDNNQYTVAAVDIPEADAGDGPQSNSKSCSVSRDIGSDDDSNNNFAAKPTIINDEDDEDVTDCIINNHNKKQRSKIIMSLPSSPQKKNCSDTSSSTIRRNSNNKQQPYYETNII
jgi:drug/metabolite transporter (DMT)-like permease